jgi:hypothetical protein
MQEASLRKPHTFHGGGAHIMQSSPIWGSAGTDEWTSDIIRFCICNGFEFLCIVYWSANVLPQLVENVATCLIKIVDRVSHSSEMLDELCKHGLIQQVTHLLSVNGRATLSQLIYNVSNFLYAIFISYSSPFFIMYELWCYKIMNLLFCWTGIDRITCQTFIGISCSLQDFIWAKYRQHIKRDIICIWPLTWCINFTACWWTL